MEQDNKGGFFRKNRQVCKSLAYSWMGKTAGLRVVNGLFTVRKRAVCDP